MGHEVLVPLDGSERAWEAFEYALEHVEADSIIVIHVITQPDRAVFVDTLGGFSEQNTFERARETAERICEEARNRAEQAGVDVERFDTVIETGRPTRTITGYVQDHDVDHVVMGSRGLTGIKRILLGSVAESVVRRSPVPVTVVR